MGRGGERELDLLDLLQLGLGMDDHKRRLARGPHLPHQTHGDPGRCIEARAAAAPGLEVLEKGLRLHHEPPFSIRLLILVDVEVHGEGEVFCCVSVCKLLKTPRPSMVTSG